MAARTTVTFVWRDSYGKVTKRTYQSRDAVPSEANVQALAQAAQNLTALQLVSATVNWGVDVTGIPDTPEAKSSRQKDASLVYQKSLLRDSTGGQYTFNIPEPKAAIVQANGSVDLTAGAVTAWREMFDDGGGIPAVVGNWYVSDGEELVEDADPIDGFLNKN